MLHTLQETFTQPLLKWFSKYGRHDLPWQHPKSAYRVWISEVMLQQTQVATVIAYFERFMTKYPDVFALAHAELDDVLALWAGLGYYSRARNLHQSAKMIVNQLNGQFPNTLEGLIQLPGVGRSTAAAIASIVYGLATPILDGNVKRVLSRFFVENNPSPQAYEAQLWLYAQDCMPKNACQDYTQAIMDLGALCCTPKKPSCESCPLNHHCSAYLKDAVEAYPPKKPRKTSPHKEAQFLLIYNHQAQIYLEKRSEKGIWGGLWSMPWLEMDMNVQTFLHKQAIIKMDDLAPLKHAFTHFRLTLHPKAILIHKHNTNIKFKASQQGQWFNINDLSTIGLPKPIATILKLFTTAQEKIESTDK